MSEVSPAPRPVTTPAGDLRIAVLWTQMSGYFRASLDALTGRGVEVVVVHERGSADAPYDPSAAAGGLHTVEWAGEPSIDRITDELEAFRPDALIVNSWHIGPYRRTAGGWRGRTLRILCMDNQWMGTPKQRLGALTSRWFIQRNYDAVLLPGDRQAAFAQRLGFPLERVIWGAYPAESPRFEKVAAARGGELPPEAFLYVGRLVADKGIDVLAEGYRRYRRAALDPWPLLVAGAGPLAHLLEGEEGVEMLGFVQPNDLPAALARGGCLVLPSRFEPWAVAIHEATCAALPVICTWACGASAHLVRDDHNGVVMTAGDVDAMAGAFARLGDASPEDRRRMGAASVELSRQYSPELWAASLVRRVHQLRVECGLSPPDLQVAERP